MSNTMKGCIFRPKFISRHFVRSHPEDLFVFGDNMIQKGYKGQAKEMRGEPNAIGVPTKWLPSNSIDAFFNDQDWLKDNVRKAISEPFTIIEEALNAGINVYIPFDGLGTGYARLDQSAPSIAKFINSKVETLTLQFSPSSDSIFN